MTKTDRVSESWQTHGEASLRGPVDVYRAVPENAVQTQKGQMGVSMQGKWVAKEGLGCFYLEVDKRGKASDSKSPKAGEHTACSDTENPCRERQTQRQPGRDGGRGREDAHIYIGEGGKEAEKPRDSHIEKSLARSLSVCAPQPLPNSHVEI